MKYLYIFFAFTILQINGQANVEMIQKEIDYTVWKPFQKAFQNLDAKALNDIYANEVIRVTPQGIDTENVFKKRNIERFMGYQKNKTKIRLDFWFDSRKTNKTTSYEVGFYRIGFTTAGATQYSYGQFHIVLQKINKEWKITQDWDTTTFNGKPITASHFKEKEVLGF